MEAYDNRHLNQREIADRVGCSSSYVSTVSNRYDGRDAMEARIEELDSQLGIGSAVSDSSRSGQTQADVPQVDWDEIARGLQNGVRGLRVLVARARGERAVADELSTGSAVAYLMQGTIVATVLGLILYFLGRAVLVAV